jgi:hypothetical protein
MPVVVCARAGASRRREVEMSEQQGPRGRVDAVAILYILGGIPAIVAFVVLLFTLVNLGVPIPA